MRILRTIVSPRARDFIDRHYLNPPTGRGRRHLPNTRNQAKNPDGCINPKGLGSEYRRGMLPLEKEIRGRYKYGQLLRLRLLRRRGQHFGQLALSIALQFGPLLILAKLIREIIKLPLIIAVNGTVVHLPYKQEHTHCYTGYSQKHITKILIPFWRKADINQHRKASKPSVF
jgi:hypothetical protein